METDFADWMRRVRAGDAEAAVDLVQQYEKAVRIAVRVRLTDPRLRTQFDSMDVCQSVMASFFVRVAAGQYDLENPRQLVALLVSMAKNKLLMQIRRHRAAQRDVTKHALVEDSGIRDETAGPEQIATGRELLQTLLLRLDPSERDLAERRARGEAWGEIAAELGGTPQAHRMKLSRAINRLAPDLGLSRGDPQPD